MLISLAIALGAAVAARADGPAFLVKDINTTQAVREPYEDEPSSYPHDFAVLDGVVYFAAGDGYDSYGEGPNGDELWRSDGTPAGTYLVKDINPGPRSALPSGLQVRDGALYFLADDSDRRPGLWRTDGTGAGTERLAAVGRSGRARGLARLGNAWLVLYADDTGLTELRRVDDAGTSSVVATLSSQYAYLPDDAQIIAGEHLAYFVLPGDATDIELWRTDGTTGGTSVLDINPGPDPSWPHDVTVVGDTAYFGATVGAYGASLWRADADGASLVFDTGSDPVGVTALDGSLLFIAAGATDEDWRLWRSDGTTAGTQPIAAVAGPPHANRPFTRFGNALYFGAFNQLWRTDGTAQGTVLLRAKGIADDNAILGIADAGAALVVVIGNSAGASPFALWRSDGTAAGTTLIRTLHPITDLQWDFIAEGRSTGNGIFVFGADDGHGAEPWRSDLSAAGTSELLEINPGATDIYTEYLLPAFADVNGTLAFTAFDGISNSVWRSDATADGTVPVTSVDGVYFSPALWPIGERVYMSYGTLESGQELTEIPFLGASARLLSDIQPGSRGSYPELLGILDGELIIAADDGVHGREPYAPYDQGLIADLSPGHDSNPRQPVIMQGLLYFLVGSSLWRTDGTALGTELVADVQAGYNSTLTAGVDRLAVIANDSGPNALLWYSDGTADGTAQVRTFAPVVDPMLAADWLPRALGFAGRTFLFAAGDEANGVELWSTDGTVAGTRTIADIAAGASNSFPSSAATRGDRVLFFADDGEHGREPWLSDGSAAGTVPLADIQPGPFGSRDRWDPEPKAIGNAFVFAATDGAHGFELWQSDGTASGTTMVQDIASDARSSTPQSFIVSGDHLFFTANDNVHGRELWAMPLTAIACAPNCPDPRTPSPTPRRTPRPVWTPGEVLPTYTPTPLPTRATTPQHCNAPGDGADCVFLNIGFARGEPGDQVEIDMRFRTGGLDVAGVQLDLLTTQALSFVAGDDGKPLCRPNPESHKDHSVFSDPFHDGTRVRALVLSLNNVDPIPDDVELFTCTFQIAADAPASIVPVRCDFAFGSTMEGVVIAPYGAPVTGPSAGELVCTDGAVTISGGPPTPTATPAEGDRGISSTGGGDGCQVNGTSAPSHSLGLLLPLTLLLLRRRGR